MTTCPPLTREMLRAAVHLRIDATDLDFLLARKAADRQARQLCAEPMLLAWFEKRTGRYSPQIPCCREDKPVWLIYAESRGGDLIIDINDEDYVFVYRRE